MVGTLVIVFFNNQVMRDAARLNYSMQLVILLLKYAKTLPERGTEKAFNEFQTVVT